MDKEDKEKSGGFVDDDMDGNKELLSRNESARVSNSRC